MTDKSNVRRSDEMIAVAYFLAKYGAPLTDQARSKPPRELGDITWKEAYEIFFDKLGEGRSISAFRNSLKNQRDTFDGHVDSGRQGWRQAGAERPAQILSPRNQKFFNRLKRMTRTEIWSQLQNYAEPNRPGVVRRIRDDLAAQDEAEKDRNSKTEGGKKVYISSRIERNPKLRIQALDYHGYDCRVCGFDFGDAYGDWGDGYAEVHHLVQLGGKNSGERETDPKTDLAVLCANCHRMTHRKRGTVLTIEELKEKLNPAYLR